MCDNILSMGTYKSKVATSSEEKKGGSVHEKSMFMKYEQCEAKRLLRKSHTNLKEKELII